MREPDSGEIQLYVQPQVELRTGRPVAGEALARWIHPDGTVMLPGQFIPQFESNNFILEFDFFMLGQLCRQMREWQDLGLAPLPVAVNQSRLHIQDKTYLKTFRGIVDRYRIPHSQIVFELTESAFGEPNTRIVRMTEELREEGFPIAVDDFGTGYASLELLSTVPADILKLDRGLLRGLDYEPRTYIVLKKVMELAHELDMSVVCEGIETLRQMEVLQELDCDYGQGFYFDRPMPVEDFAERVLRSGNKRDSGMLPVRNPSCRHRKQKGQHVTVP